MGGFAVFDTSTIAKTGLTPLKTDDQLFSGESMGSFSPGGSWFVETRRDRWILWQTEDPGQE
jgi:hypothetical protein